MLFKRFTFRQPPCRPRHCAVVMHVQQLHMVLPCPADQGALQPGQALRRVAQGEGGAPGRHPQQRVARDAHPDICRFNGCQWQRQRQRRKWQRCFGWRSDGHSGAAEGVWVRPVRNLANYVIYFWTVFWTSNRTLACCCCWFVSRAESLTNLAELANCIRIRVRAT